MGKLVLVVEDDKKQNEHICEIVKLAGYKPIPAYNGMEGLATYKKYQRGLGFLPNKFSCILLDWQMPKMRGEEFLQILRRQEHWKTYSIHTPVIVITAYDEREKRYLAANSSLGRAADYITKPINEARLIDTLHRVIRDKDNETLVEINRERGFGGSKAELEEQLAKAEEHIKKAKEDYLSGKINKYALEYIEKKKSEAEMEYKEAKKIGKLDEQALKNLEMVMDSTKKEYHRLLNQMPKDEMEKFTS